MAHKEIRVLHIDSEKTWRGGQQQVYYLHEGLTKKSIFSLLICKSNSEIHKRCISNNLDSIEVSMKNEVDLFSAYKISRICKKNKISILHTHSAHALALGLLTKIFYRKVKLIGVRRVDFHLKKNILSRIKYNNRLIDKMICVSEAIKKILMTDGLNKNKLITIHDGIDVNKFDNVILNEDFKEKLGIKSENIVVGTIAAFAGHKDYPNLIKAAKKVIDEFVTVSFIAVGDGALKNEMEKLVKKLNIDNNFIFAGFQSDVGKFLKVFDIFVLSSKLEGLGTSILDAQSVGLPVVATNTGGIPEVIKNNVNGILVKPKNHYLLAKAILKLIEDPQKRENLSFESIQSVKNFSIENTVEQNINLYEELFDK